MADNTGNDKPRTCPYVGGRPYNSEDSMYFVGREKDARMLCDKIFSSRLTILYAPSGVGKTSLLRCRVIPFLAKEEARVFYFKKWTSEDPSAYLRSDLMNLARSVGVHNPEEGSPTLAELIGLISIATGKTIVLIFDQFEEFLNTHPQHLDLIKKEIGDLVRAGNIDIRILISLRQEFLASLEPFHQEILNLFQSTYLLQNLDDEAIKKVIQEPAYLFNKYTYEEELVKALIDENFLRSKTSLDAPGARFTGVDLFMLQIVLVTLWEQAWEKENPITYALYENLGKAEKIIKTYVETLMPTQWSDQLLTAKLLKHLAPPSGMKMSYSAEDLASVTNESVDDIRTALQRMAVPEKTEEEDKRGVLRRWPYSTGERFELLHDAYAKILIPWRDNILSLYAEERSKTYRRNSFLVAATIFVLICLSAGIALWQYNQYELRMNTKNIWDRPETEMTVTQKFDHVASYLLWSRGGTNRFDLLEKILKGKKTNLPQDYGVERSGSEFITLPDPKDDNWPLTLRYSSARELNEYMFTLTWQEGAKYLTEVWGIPVPLKIRLVRDDTYPKEVIRLEGHGIEPLVLDKIPAYEQDAFISMKDISVPGRLFLERIKDACKPIPQVKRGGPWWIVPRWSLPAWKASGIHAIDGSGLPALLLMVELQEKNDRLLTQDSVEILLNRIEKVYPATVSEARTVRGDRLVHDLQEIVKHGYALTGLPTMLDVLASYPEGSSTEIEENVASDIDSAQASLPSRFSGPHKTVNAVSNAGRKGASDSPKAIQEAYKETENWLPNIEPEIRLYLGKYLDQACIAEDYKLKPEYRELVGRTCDNIQHRFGITMPQPEVRGMEWEPTIPSNAFRIEILDQNEDNPEAGLVMVSEKDALDRLNTSLRCRYELYRTNFLSAERVDDLLNKNLDKGLRDWILKQYSLTDLKLLLRSVINPSVEELKDRHKALNAGDTRKTFKIPPENSIRYPSWLLASLVFWSKVHDVKSLQIMTADLLITQSGRLKQSKPEALKNPEVARTLEEGIRSLSAGHVVKADELFTRAIKYDKASAVSSFPVLYAREFRNRQIQKLTASCKDYGQPLLHVDLEDALAEQNFDQNTSVATARQLRLCLLASYPEYYHQTRNTLAQDIIRRYSNPKDWPADEAAWFGKELLTCFNPLTDNKMVMDKGLAFLQRGLSQLDAQEASGSLEDIINICEKPGPNRWCWNLLPKLANTRQDGTLEAMAAEALAHSEAYTNIERALELAQHAKSNLRNALLPKERKTYFFDLANFTRAFCLLSLAMSGIGEPPKEAETILVKLQASPKFASSAYNELAALRLRENRIKEAQDILSSVKKQWPDDQNLYSGLLMLNLVLGDRNGVSQIALDALKKVKKDEKGNIEEESQDFSYVATLGLLITETGPWEQTAREFLRTKNKYVPYIAMMLSSRLIGKDREDARKVIESYWMQARPDTWQARLREGDETVWREMLLGYYLGSEKVRRDDIFSTLEDEKRFAQSDLRFVPLPRLGMLCEAYFYDALLAEFKGNTAQMRTSLENVLKTNYRVYYEYDMAKFLLHYSLR
jgi:hypothetical protein